MIHFQNPEHMTVHLHNIRAPICATLEIRTLTITHRRNSSANKRMNTGANQKPTETFNPDTMVSKSHSLRLKHYLVR